MMLDFELFKTYIKTTKPRVTGRVKCRILNMSVWNSRFYKNIE